MLYFCGFVHFCNIFTFERFIGNDKPLKITENRFFESITDKTVASKRKTVCTHTRPDWHSSRLASLDVPLRTGLHGRASTDGPYIVRLTEIQAA